MDTVMKRYYLFDPRCTWQRIKEEEKRAKEKQNSKLFCILSMIVISLIFHLTPTSESLYPSGENLDLSFCKPPILPLGFSSLFGHCLLSSEKRRVLASLIWAMQLEFLTSNKLSICDLVFCILLCLQGAGPFDPAPQS